MGFFEHVERVEHMLEGMVEQHDIEEITLVGSIEQVTVLHVQTTPLGILDSVRAEIHTIGVPALGAKLTEKPTGARSYIQNAAFPSEGHNVATHQSQMPVFWIKNET